MECAPVEYPEPDAAVCLLGKRPIAHILLDERELKRQQLH
jgi:hypothetical protein